MKKAADLIQGVLDSMQLGDARGYTSFLGSWIGLVGADLAVHCQPSDVRRGVLIIEVDHPGWQQKFKMIEKKVLADIQKRFGQLGVRRFGYVYVETGQHRTKPVAERLIQDESESMPTPIAPANPQPSETPNPPADLGAALESLRRAMQTEKK